MNKIQKVLIKIIIVLTACALILTIYYFTFIRKKISKTFELEEKESKKNSNIKTEEIFGEEIKDIILIEGKNFAYAYPNLQYELNFRKNYYDEMYNTTYDIYRDGKKIGTTNGKVSEDVDVYGKKYYYMEYEGIDYKETKEYIFVSTDYDVMPREYTEDIKIPTKVKNEIREVIGDAKKVIIDTNVQSNIDNEGNSISEIGDIRMQSIDLYGDGNFEHIVIFYEMNGYVSGISLFDPEYNRMANLYIGRNSYEMVDIKMINYIDINNDEKMEILIKCPPHKPSPYNRVLIYDINKDNKTGKYSI